MKRILFAFILFSLCGCSKQKQNETISSDVVTYDYSDIVDRTIQWSEILSQEANYYAYVYSETCGHCKEIKQEVLKYAIEINQNFYFILFNKEIPIIEKDSSNIGIDNYLKLGICGTPTLFEINNHVVITCYTGSKAIINTLTRTYE